MPAWRPLNDTRKKRKGNDTVIHQYQNNIAPREIFLKTCKKDFDPNYYIEYLCDKYTKLYELENVA